MSSSSDDDDMDVLAQLEVRPLSCVLCNQLNASRVVGGFSTTHALASVPPAFHNEKQESSIKRERAVNEIFEYVSGHRI